MPVLSAFLFVAVLIAAPRPSTPASPALPYGQDLRVPGSKVSVRLEKDERGANRSSLFLDEQYDTRSKTFVQFRCGEGGRLNFFLKTKVPLLSEADLVSGRPPALTYRVDGQQPRTFPGVLTRKGGDFDRFVLATNDVGDTRFLAAFRAARRGVTVQVRRTGGAAPLTLTFPVTGFQTGLQVLEGCPALP